MSQSPTNPTKVSSEKRHYSWLLLIVTALVVMGISGSVGFVATSLLLKLPKAESCPKIFWPLASASMRLYCAQLAAQEKTVDAWVEAIEMVEVLPSQHPMRSEVNSNVEAWVGAILTEGEKLFQSGQIDAAVTLTEKIPPNTAAAPLVTETLSRWRTVWAEGQRKEEQIAQYLSTRNWSKAFREAVQLTNIDNQYWARVKYEENLNQIQRAKEESGKLDTAYTLLESGEIEDILTAMTEAEKIDNRSSAYQEAQALIDEAQNNLLKLIQTKVEQKDWQGLEASLGKISPEVDLGESLEDWYRLAQAGTTANQGTTSSLEKAIAQAETIPSKSPVYYEAQKLINYWNLEIEDVESLTEARSLAAKGNIPDFEEAIAIADTIPSFHPRYQEAQTEISQWNRQIQIIEDQPLLARAQKLAAAQTVDAWQEAITQASQITPNRPLYPQAQKLIQQCRYKIQVVQDKPILDQAIQMAEGENWAGAIAKARQIGSRRALSGEAQEKIRVWQQQINALENLQEAYRLAETQRPNDLIRAMQLASQIPDYTKVAAESQQAINQWAEELLFIAQETSDYSYDEAIAIAQNIPRNTSVYNSARTYIEIWKKKKSTPSLAWPES